MKIGSCLPIVFSQVIYSGGYSDGEPALPIPNREAKPVIADGTARPGGRVGSRRALKESSDEKSSGGSFVFAGVRGNAVQDIPVFRGWRMWPAPFPPGRSNFCTCPRHMSTQVSLRPVPVAGLCGPVVTCFPVGCRPGPAYRWICPGFLLSSPRATYVLE